MSPQEQESPYLRIVASVLLLASVVYFLTLGKDQTGSESYAL